MCSLNILSAHSMVSRAAISSSISCTAKPIYMSPMSYYIHFIFSIYIVPTIKYLKKGKHAVCYCSYILLNFPHDKYLLWRQWHWLEGDSAISPAWDSNSADIMRQIYLPLCLFRMLETKCYVYLSIQKTQFQALFQRISIIYYPPFRLSLERATLP